VNSMYDVIHGFYADGLPHSLKLVGVEPIQTPFFWTACIGMVVAWRWQLIGGALSLGLKQANALGFAQDAAAHQ
jgi:hypothetical protein